MRCCTVAPARGAPDPDGIAGTRAIRAHPRLVERLGDLAGLRAERTVTAAAHAARVGQSGGASEHVNRQLAVRTRGDAAVHAAERILAEHGGVRATHHLRTRAEWAASAACGASDDLAGRHGGWLER